MARGKRLYTIPRIDILFAILGVVGAVLIFREPRMEAMAAASAPLLQMLVALGATALITAVAIWAGKFDRRCAEDYVFQLTANAALVAIPATMFLHAIWDMDAINRMGLAKPTSGDMVGVMILSWALAYGLYRVRGVHR